MSPHTQGRTPLIPTKCVPTQNGPHATDSASRVPPATKREHDGASPQKDARVPNSRKGCVPASPLYKGDAGRATGHRTTTEAAHKHWVWVCPLRIWSFSLAIGVAAAPARGRGASVAEHDAHVGEGR